MATSRLSPKTSKSGPRRGYEACPEPVSQDSSWEGVVTDKKRSSPDGQNMDHRLAVTLGDGTVKEVRVRRALWKSLEPGDRIVKRPDETAPVKIT